MVEIRVEPLPSNHEVIRRLNRLNAAVDDLSPVMLKISERLQAQVERNFDAQRAPDGAPWAPLLPDTLKERARKGYVHPKTGVAAILQRTRNLLDSVQPDHGRDFAVIGTNPIYAATHQFGRNFGRGNPIPARPFLGVGNRDAEEILDIVQRHLEEAT